MKDSTYFILGMIINHSWKATVIAVGVVVLYAYFN